MQMPSKLMNRNFFLLWQGQTVSRLGIQAFEIAMLFWIKHATESATLMGLMMMLSNLPVILLGPIGGTFADRHSRRKIILISDALNGIAILSLAGLLFLAPDATEAILVWLFVVSLCGAVSISFFSPAISAAIPDLVPKDSVSTANSLFQSSTQISVFVGQGIGGMLFRLLGAPVLFLINGLTYLFSAASMLFIAIPQTLSHDARDHPSQSAAFKRDVVDGFRYIWHRDGLRELVFVSAFLNFFTVPIIVLLPFFVEDFLKASVDWYGFLIASYGIGSVIGYIFAGAFKWTGAVRYRVMAVIILLESLGYGLLGIANSPLTALALALIGGAAGGFVTIIITTLLQVTTPGDMRGRVFGLLSTVSGSLAPIAMGLTGIVADALGRNIPLIYLSCSAVMVVLSVFVLARKEFRHFLADEHSESSAPTTAPEILSEAGR